MKIDMLRDGRRLLAGISCLSAVILLCAGEIPLAHAAQDPEPQDAIHSGVMARDRGNIQLSIDILGQAWEAARSPDRRMRAAAELGTSLLQARRFDDAEKFLLEAYSGSSGIAKARVAVELGNLAEARKNSASAGTYYEEAETLAGDNLSARLPASLNRARVLPKPDRLPVLNAIYGDIADVGEPKIKARLYLNLGSQASGLGPRGLGLAYRSVAEAKKLLPRLDERLVLETLDAMAQLYEDENRMHEALQLTQSALDTASAESATNNEDVLVRLEWRKGRISRLEGNRRIALIAYQHAATHLESIRQDLPIEYADGRSSYRETLQPIFNGVVDLILTSTDDLSDQDRTASLRTAIHALELTKQSEMQDYLGDRCSVDAVRSDTGSAIPAKSAVLYPILLPDRLELILETDDAIVRRTVKVSGSEVRLRALFLAKALSRYWSDSYMPASQQLYDWLLRPFETEFAKRNIQTIVVVSDGPLRLIPFGALHDGKQFAIERYALTTVTGMTMTSVKAPGKTRIVALLAGLSEPGPVIDKLTTADAKSILVSSSEPNPAPASTRSAPLIRSPRSRAPQEGVGAADTPQRAARLREDLALPGVKAEIQDLKAILPNVSIEDQTFTLGRFSQEVASGDYRILHVASHGVFGGSASSSYIMTYDELLTMNRFESLLRGKQGDTTPIELLTLSACETAEGDERSPLGISGAAIKARARSVIGTLWPVGDEAAREIMDKFYEGLAKNNYSKAVALQDAQRDLLKNEAFSHPFFWAPFVLIGNWM